MRKIITNNWQFIIVCFIACVVLFNHIFYVIQTNQYPEMDEQHYMYMSVGFYKLLQHATIQTPLAMLTYLPVRQPGYPLLILPFLLLIGIQHAYFWALILNGIFFITSIFATYFLGKALFDKSTGVIAALLFASYGWTLFYLHFTYSETAATTFVILSILFLWKSYNFQNKTYSIAFGVAFGYGILIRWVIPLFIAGPLLMIVLQSLRNNAFKKKARGNIILSIILALMIGSLPYIINNKAILNNYVAPQVFKGALLDTVPVVYRRHLSLQSAAYYFKIFEQLNIFFFLLFLAGLVYSVFRITREKIFLLLAFIVPYLAFSFGTIIKDDRYIVPIYPTIALISAGVINNITVKIAKIISIFFIIFVCIASFLGGLWGIGPLGHEGLQSILIPFGIGHPRRIHISSMVWPPTKNYSNAEMILRTIDGDSSKNRINKPSIIMLFSYHPLDNALYAISTYERLQPYAMQNFVGIVPSNKEQEALTVAKELQLADYILIKTGKTIEYYFPGNNYLTLRASQFAFQQNISELEQNLFFIKKIPIPLDKSNVIIYRKIKQFSDRQMQLFKDSFIQFLNDNKS